MESLTLTSEEKVELKKRGFYVKEYLSFFNFLVYGILSILKTLLLLLLCALPIMILGGISQTAFDFFHNINGLSFIVLGLPVVFLLKYIKMYIFSGKFFFGEESILALGKVFTDPDQISRDKNYIKFGFFQGHKDRVYLLIIASIFILFWVFILGLVGFMDNPVIPLFIMGGVLSFVLPIFFLRQLVEHYHPLYAFGNLGEKIQKLTPEIEEKSKEIQENFKSDMNFRVLSDGFDSLAKTFSEIITLVIRLEKIEQKANKGNLFDSEKYINSLRIDIVEPLKSLKSFLEKQRVQLLHSQKELEKIGTLDPSLHSGGQKVMVKVGGGDPETNTGGPQIRVSVGGEVDSGSSPEGQRHLELSSKRSESLLAELDENIGKLDGMIGKMGKR